jgi:DNA replication and repair protein RecF
MHLSRLRLRNFRNFADQTLELPAQGVAIIGNNGQGKTNLLEAIYYLEIFRSFRGAPDEQLVRFGEDVFRIDGQLIAADGTSREVAAAFDRRGRRKKVEVGGAEPPRIGDAIGRVGAVIFSPSDVEIVSGSPGARRRFLDIVLSLTAPGYLSALQRYRQVLSQRNAVLRQGTPAAVVGAWNEGLVGWGSRVIEARARWVADRAPSFARHVSMIAEGTPAVLEYDASTPATSDDGEPMTIEEVAEAFHRELARVEEREQRRGMTVVGPHRDDLRVRAESDAGGAMIDLRTYGSGGQQRTAAVALRIIEAESLKEARGWEPIVLLDDVFAELDPRRSRRILDWVEQGEGGQVILTAPKPSDFDVRGGTLPRWQIVNGEVSEL